MDHNQTGSPTFNPGILKVAIKGGTNVSKERKITRILFWRGPLVGIHKNIGHTQLICRSFPYEIIQMTFQGREMHHQTFSLKEANPQFQKKDQKPFKTSGVVGQSLRIKCSKVTRQQLNTKIKEHSIP